MAYTYNLSTQTMDVGQEDCEFKASKGMWQDPGEERRGEKRREERDKETEAQRKKKRERGRESCLTRC